MPKVAHHQLSQIGTVYCDFLTQVDAYFADITICITIPVYRFYETNVVYHMISAWEEAYPSRTIQAVPQMYERK